MKKPVVKLTKKVYEEAVKKAFVANQLASKKKTTTSKPAPTKMPAMPKTKTKAPAKKRVLVMPDKISPSKMTPAQKARYLKNPERYDG